jgi:hypothetical protein
MIEVLVDFSLRFLRRCDGSISLRAQHFEIEAAVAALFVA